MRKIDWLVIILVVVLDQVSKIGFSGQALNTGVAFGLGQNLAWEAVSGLLLIIIGFMYFQTKRFWEKLGLILIFASGLSNLLDRLFIGGVRDFIYWPILQVYGNIADVFLTIGVLIVILSIVADL